MNRLVLLFLLSLPLSAGAAPKLKVVRSSDFHPNPNFQPVRRFDSETLNVGKVEQVGEVVILEGDDTTVSTSKDGYGIVFDGRAQNPLEITTRFYTRYADEFDEIIIFTTFDDVGASGAAAYEISAQQDIDGVGQDKFDESSYWGSKGSLHAFVNMMKWDQFDYGVPLTDLRNDLYSTLGQEFAHRWLAFLRYKDQDGNISTAMLGRDQAHWASTLQADGSVMDGNLLTLDADGFYETSRFMTTYSTLDLYAMGLLAPNQVQPWFLLKNVVRSTGRTVDPAQWLPNGAKLKAGSREDITIDQVVAAEGPRMPSMAESPHAFRVAFVLVTRPGEHASEVIDIARKLDQVRTVWEQAFKQFSYASGSMCTQVSAPCGVIPAAHIDGGEIREHGGNANGVAEPGEPVLVAFHVLNDSQLQARHVEVATQEGFVSDVPSVVLEDLPPGARRDVLFTGKLPEDAVCGEPFTIEVASTVDGHTFRGFAEITPGLAVQENVSFAANRAGWSANPDGKDSAVNNGWTYGSPVLYRGNSGWILQPSGCHASDKCWFTGLQKGHRAMQDSSLALGESRLISAPLTLKGSYHPVLTYWAWFQAIDFSNAQQGGVDATGVTMVVEGTVDGGQTWVAIDTIDSSQPNWQRREVPLDGLVDLSGKLQLRFTASNPAATTSVEAGIDELSISTLTPRCNPESAMTDVTPKSSGGCSLGGRAPVTGLLGLFLLCGVALLRRRRA